MYKGWIKRGFDVLCSLIFILCFWWLYIIVALFVRVKLGSPVLFKQERPGLNGKIFTMYKFRSMTDSKDKNGVLLSDEERLPRFGQLLRATSLDEIPEFFNILKGDMSLVGPRPLLVEYLPRYNAFQARRHEVKPGVTGWAQINGRNNITWERKFEYDVEYVNKQSFLLDMKIIFLTIKKIFIKEGINQEGNVTVEDFMGSNIEILKKKKRVLIVTTLQETIEAFLIPHIKFLEEEGYEVEIATNVFQDIPEELENLKWYNIPFSRNPFNLRSIRAISQMRELIRNREYEMVHLHTPVAAFLGRYAAQKEEQKNIVYTAHGFHFFKGAPLINWLVYYPLEKLGMRWTDKLITINSEDYERALDFKLRSGGKVFKMNGIGVSIDNYSSGDAKKIKRELLISEIETVFSIIGDLNRNKNHKYLLEILEELKRRGRKVRAIFTGYGELEEELRQEALNRGVKVSFLGYRKDIPDIIAASDFICSMSYREGLPRNVMEGMAQGKPIIATNIRGNRDLVTDGENGVLIELDDVDTAVSKILELLDNSEKYKQISENNLERIKQYSIETVLNKMREVYGIEKVSNS